MSHDNKVLFTVNYSVDEDTANKALDALQDVFPDMPGKWQDLTPKQRKLLEIELKIFIADTIDTALQKDVFVDDEIALDDVDPDLHVDSENGFDIDRELDKLYR